MIIGLILANFVSTVIFINLILSLSFIEKDNYMETSNERDTREQTQMITNNPGQGYISDSDWDMSELLGGDISDFDDSD